MQEPSATNKTRRLEWIVWGALFLTVLAIAGAFVFKRVAQVNSPPAPPIIGPVGHFTLTNQHGRAVSSADLRGSVWIANIVFTRCAGPCPVITQTMRDLQNSIINPGMPVRFITLTTDPDHDTPDVLKRFGEKYGADFHRWSFLTGPKSEIARLAIDGLKLVAQEKPAAERSSDADLFIHSTIFVLVDQDGNLRATFDIDDPAFKARLLQTTDALLKAR